MPRSLAAAVSNALHRRNLILSPRVTNYLARHPDGLWFSPEVAARIGELMTKRPRVRSGSFSPSSSGDCRRRQVFAFIGTPGTRPHSTDLRNLFSDGTWRHLRWQAMGLEDRWFTGVEVDATMPGTLFKGSMDGANDPEGWLFELKGTSATESAIRKYFLPAAEELSAGADPTSIDLSQNTYLGAFVKAWQQVQRYFAQTGDRYTAAVLMFEPKGSQSFVEVNVTPTPVGQAIAHQEMDRLSQYAADKTLPAVLKECTSKNSAKRRQCPYGKVCIHTYEWNEALPERTITIKRKS